MFLQKGKNSFKFFLDSMVPQGILKKNLVCEFVKSASVCGTWEEEEEEQEEEQEQETRTSFVAGELGCGGSHTFKVIVVKKQNCKKILLKIDMHGSLLAS